MIAILESTGFHSDSIESSIELLLPFFLIREGKFKLIHPILGSGHTIGLFEKCSPAVNSLVNHYLSDESYEGDEHVIYAWTEQIKAEFYWTMGGTSRAKLLISSALDRIESASEITMLYDRRRHLFYAFMMYACAVNFDQYRKFCHRVESIVKEHSHLAVFRIMLEDDRILSDFPLLVFCISKALKYSETQRDALLLKHKKYRIICGAILRELKGSWRPNVRFERVDFIERAIMDANYKLEPGSLLYSLVTLYEQAYNSGKVPYSFKMFSFLVERRGLEYINNT